MELTAPSARGTPAIREDSPAEEFIAWSLERFSGQSLVLTTAFGMEGCALVDLYARHGRPLKVVYVDTQFFFPETYELRDRMVERYPHLEFARYAPVLSPEAQEEAHGPALWLRDPDACCRMRKVDPMREAMRGADVWVTAVRRGQSAGRQGLRRIEWDWKYQVIKLNPLADWTREQVWEYVRANGVPYNALHEKGYPSIGCTHCTKRVEGIGPGEYSREGRWNGKEKTECGLHGYGI